MLAILHNVTTKNHETRYFSKLLVVQLTNIPSNIISNQKLFAGEQGSAESNN